MVVASFKGRESWQTRLSLFLLATISGNVSEKASPVSMNDISLLLERISLLVSDRWRNVVYSAVFEKDKGDCSQRYPTRTYWTPLR